MFEAYKIGVAIQLTNHVSGGLSTIMRDFAKTDAEAAKLKKRIDSIRMGLTGGLVTAGVGIAMASMFKPAIDEAMKFERAMLRLKDIGGINSGVINQVRSDALSGKYPGIGAAESVDLVRDLHAAFGDAKEALEFMPLFAGMARVTQGKYGKSAVAGEEDTKALAKVAERRGGTKSASAMESALDLSMMIQNASGGAVSPKDLLAFMARMGAMGNAMSNTGIMKMWALMQEQGGSKAGTALNSAMQNLVNGRGTEGSGSVLRRIGWIDEKKNEEGLKSLYGANWTKHLNKVTANSLKNADGAKEDMVGWIASTGLPLIDAYLTKKGVDPKKRAAETVSLLAQALSNRLGADSIALIATQLPRIMKDYHIAESSAGLKDSIDSYDNSPMAKFQKLHADWDTALTNLGEAALPIAIPLVNKLADGIKKFSVYAEKNPDLVAGVVKGVLGLAAGLVLLGGFTVLVNGVRALYLAGALAKTVVTSLPGLIVSVSRSLGGRLMSGLRLLGNGIVIIGRILMVAGRALLLNPIGLVITAIGVAAYVLWKNWDIIKPKLDAAWEGIKTGWNSFINFFVSIWERAKSLLPNFIVGAYAAPSTAAGGPKVAGAPYASPALVSNAIATPAQSARTINNTIVMPDGRVLASVVTTEQAKAASGPQVGTSSFDINRMPLYPGMIPR